MMGFVFSEMLIWQWRGTLHMQYVCSTLIILISWTVLENTPFQKTPVWSLTSGLYTMMRRNGWILTSLILVCIILWYQLSYIVFFFCFVCLLTSISRMWFVNKGRLCINFIKQKEQIFSLRWLYQWIMYFSVEVEV